MYKHIINLALRAIVMLWLQNRENNESWVIFYIYPNNLEMQDSWKEMEGKRVAVTLHLEHTKQ